MPTWLPTRMLDQAEQRDFLSGVQPYMADLQRQVQSGISDLTASARGLAQRAMAPQPSPARAPVAPGGPSLDAGADRGYLDAAAPTAPPDIPQPYPNRTPQAPPAPSSIEPFTLPSFESLTGGPQAAPVAPAAAGTAPRNSTDRSPFSLPTWSDLTGFAEPVRQAAQQAASSVTAGLPPGAPTPALGGMGAPPSSAAAPTARPAEPKGEVDNSSRAAFIRTAYPWALEAADGDPTLANQLLATAISENGKVGTGRSLGEMGFNVGGIQGVKGPAGSFMASDAGNMREFAAYNSLAEGFRAVRDLVSGGRYQPAAGAYRQTGDVDRYWQDVNRAGYAEDPNWHAKVGSIRRGQVEPITSGLAAAPAETRPSPATTGPAGVPTAVAEGAGWRETWGKDLTPNQINETLNLGLSWDAALATCGVAAAVAFGRANGRAPTFKEALELAKATGEWNADVGMTRGTTGQLALLKGLGVEARAAPLAEGEVAAAVQRGQPVQINAHGNGGHFYVAQGYDPQTRKFDFGNSAAILKRSGGNTWYRLDELPSLGVGTPSEAIYLAGGR